MQGKAATLAKTKHHLLQQKQRAQISYTMTEEVRMTYNQELKPRLEGTSKDWRLGVWLTMQVRRVPAAVPTPAGLPAALLELQIRGLLRLDYIQVLYCTPACLA